MNVTFDEGKLFYDLYAALLSFVNGKLKVISEQFSDSEGYTALPPGKRLAVRDALYADRQLLDEFVKIGKALTDYFGPIGFQIPSIAEQPLSSLKRYEDSLDALVCAWVGAEHLAGRTVPYGDSTAAIWCPP
jgi:hypothetical protein